MNAFGKVAMITGLALASLAAFAFVGSILWVSSMCADHGGCAGTDGDAWMLPFFLAFPGIPGIAILGFSFRAWWTRP